MLFRFPHTCACTAAAALGKTECLGILLRSAKGSDAANVKDSSSRWECILLSHTHARARGGVAHFEILQMGC